VGYFPDDMMRFVISLAPLLAMGRMIRPIKVSESGLRATMSSIVLTRNSAQKATRMEEEERRRNRSRSTDDGVLSEKSSLGA